MSTNTIYPKRKLESVPFQGQLDFIEKANRTKGQYQTFHRYHNNNNNNSYNHGVNNNNNNHHHHHHNNNHNHHQHYLQQQQQNKYALAAVAAAAAVQHQQQQTYLLQKQQAQQAALAQQKQQQQQQQQQQQNSHYMSYPSQSHVYAQTQPPPQVFADVPMEKTNSATISSSNQSVNNAPYDLKTNFMLYNGSSTSISSPTNSQFGSSKQNSTSSQSSSATTTTATFTTKLFDNHPGSSANNSPVLLPPNSNKNSSSSPPNLFLSTSNRGAGTGSPLLSANLTPTTTTFLNSPSLVPVGGSGSNTWNVGVSTPTTTSSIWGTRSSGTSTTLTPTPIAKSGSNIMSGFGSSNLW